MSNYVCPNCGGKASRVYHVAQSYFHVNFRRIEAVRRKRECLTCRTRWSTLEVSEQTIRKEMADPPEYGGGREK